jgi:fructuronate reductase
VRLSEANLSHLAAEVERPGYDRSAQAVGIVHFGIGAFHRAHQAWYTDRAMAQGDRNWAICGVSLRSAAVAEQMNPQDGLFTVTERSGSANATRLVGSVRNVLVAAQDRQAVTQALASPATCIASFTVTEKGYCRAADGGLDPDQANEASFFACLAPALRQRCDAGMPGLTLLSCDNLADNGRQLDALMEQYLDRHDPELLSWFRQECACPSTMVDRIVPATTEADRAALADRIGLTDHGAVMTEPFSQWVIEDRFAGPRPRWEAVGAELVSDVRPYENAKLRLLNGAHSLLAYCGLKRGHAFVHQAVADPVIRPLVERLLRVEAPPTIAAAPGQNLEAYGDALLDRFANPALQHRLIQIAMDGSQKIPQRWLETLADNQQQGRGCPAILAGIAGWIAHLRGANGPVDDPRAVELTKAASAADPVSALFGAGGLMASCWLPGDTDRAAVTAAMT